jgi:hypothetical protein
MGGRVFYNPSGQPWEMNKGQVSSRMGGWNADNLPPTRRILLAESMSDARMFAEMKKPFVWASDIEGGRRSRQEAFAQHFHRDWDRAADQWMRVPKPLDG